MKSDKLEDTYLWEYYQAIRSGEIIAGHELITELEKLIDDYDNPDYYIDRSKALFKMSFMENCVRLTKSPFYGKPMKLMLWQKAFIESIYAWKMAEDGTDRFRRVLLLISRKNTKSEMCSGIALTELITGADGSDIVCSSNDDNQANILYDAINTMRLMIDPQQKDTWKTQQYLRCNINGSKVFKLSDRTRNKEGRNIDFAVVDEVHEMKDNTIVKSIEQSQSLKPNPKLILITTEGFVNDGYLDEELRKARAILNNEDDSLAAMRYLPWLYTQDSEQEVWKDETSWFKSNPSLGVVKRWDYLREQVDLARKSKADRMFTLSKDFNIKVSNSEAWLTSDQLSYSKEFDIEDFRGAVCLGGVDLAETTDLCSAKALLMRYDDKTKYIKSMYWIPESKLERSPDTEAGAKYSEWAKAGLIRIVEGNEIDVSLIADWYFELYKDFGIKTYKVGYDQRFANEFIKRMDEYSFETEMVYQNRYVLSSPMRLVEADIQDELINFNNNEIDRWCLENTAVQVWDTGHIMPIKIKGQSSKRIDGTLSLVMSYEMLRRHRTEFNNTLL
jgi:phage terminase large subunit-like protein